MAEYLASDELVDDEADLAAERLARGTRLGRYELLLPIAKGGMARVWAACQHGQRGFTKLVAIKTILPHLARDAEFERMFLDEARIASMVHHPHVCEIYELGEEGRVLYLAMEWVNGESLAHILRVSGRCEPLEPRIVARIVSDACAGLNAAHNLRDDDGQALNVVHRDVSPHNILVSADGHVKVADFGVAKALGQHHSSSSAGQLKGKINYMAPEQVTGSGIDRRSDLFSMGCVLYEATTGLQPFKGEGDHQVMHKLLKGELVPPSRIVPGYPPELEEIVLCAMAPLPDQRFASADRMRIALEEWLAKGPVVTADTHVAGAVRARVGGILDKRRERIRAAQTTTERVEIGTDPPLVEGLTPSGRARSGVKPAGSPGPNARMRSSPSLPPVSAPPLSGVPRSQRPPSSTPSLPPSSRPHPSLPPPSLPPPSEPGAPFPPVLEARIDAFPLPEESTGSTSAQGPLPRPANGEPAGAYPLIGAALGVVMLAALGAIGFFLWRARALTPPPAPAPISARAVAPPVSASPPPPAPIDTTITVETIEPITFRVSPESAILLVDGVPQAPGMRAVTRKPGEPIAVIVRAPGYEDEVVMIDDAFAKRVVVVTLSPVRRPRGGGDRSGGDPAGKPSEPLPANPY